MKGPPALGGGPSYDPEQAGADRPVRRTTTPSGSSKGRLS